MEGKTLGAPLPPPPPPPRCAEALPCRGKLDSLLLIGDSHVHMYIDIRCGMPGIVSEHKQALVVYSQSLGGSEKTTMCM